MKYLSLIAVVVFLQLTWLFFQKDATLTVRQQNRMLNIIKEYMTQKVLEKEPNAAQIQFANLHTEIIEPGKTLKAHFKFSYLQSNGAENQNKVHRKGHFLVTSSDGSDWKAQISDINDVQVEFINPLNIEGDVDNPVDDPSSTPQGDSPTETQNSGH